MQSDTKGGGAKNDRLLSFYFVKWDCNTGPCKVRNETETKRNETKQIETKRNKSKRNETDRNETKQIETKRNKTKRNKSKRNETNNMASHCGQKSVFSNIRKLETDLLIEENEFQILENNFLY